MRIAGQEIATTKPAHHIHLTEQQKINIRQLSYYQAIKGETYTADVIYDLWPTDPSEEWRAGRRPSVTAIQQFRGTQEFRELMLEVGIETHELRELTQEQMSAISLLTNITDGRSPKAKLKALGIPYSKYLGWLKQNEFNETIGRITGSALTQAIPLAEVKLAEKAAEGHLPTIKFLFELTGRHDPNKQAVVDVQALMNVMIDAAQKVFGKGDPELYREFVDTVRLEATRIKGV